MSVKNELLSQCLDLAKQLMKNNQKATINISVGTDFNFKFSNLEHASFTEKYKSPSQKKRSLERKAQYDLKNLNNFKASDVNVSPDLNKKKCGMKDYATQPKDEKIVKGKDSETQTGNEKQVKYKDSETQTFEPDIFKPEFSVEPENNDEEEAIETIVNESDIFPCESCSKIFNFNKDVKEHMCDVCKIAIAEREHILLPNSYQCDICKRSFKTKTQFKQHKLCSYKENSFSNICEVCNKLWTKKDDFEYHMQQKYCRHNCVRCKAILERKEQLDAHFRTKHRAF